MELVGGIGIFVLLIVGVLHSMVPNNIKLRMGICICLAVVLCFTGTIHGVLLAIGIVFVEMLVNKAVSFWKNLSL